MSCQLILSKKSAVVTASVDEKVTKELKTYQKNIIRHLYNCFTNKLQGAILNVDLHMIYEHALAVVAKVLVKQTNTKDASIVICSKERSLYWYYFMKKYAGIDVYMISESNIDRLLSKNEPIIIILAEEDFKVYRSSVKNHHCFCVFVDQVDYFIEKQLTKQINADFHVGITHHNFTVERNQKLQWNIINWATGKKKFANQAEFMEYDDVYFAARVDPYTDFWYTIRWHFDASTRKPSKEQLEELQNKVASSRQGNDFPSTSVITRTTLKRKTKSNSKISAPKKPKTKTRNCQIVHAWSSDDDVDTSIISGSSKTYSIKQEKLPLKKSQTICISELFDQAVLDEFSKPFEGTAHTAKKSHSDSFIVSERGKAIKEAILDDLNDVDIIEEFSNDFEHISELPNLIKHETSANVSDLLSGEILSGRNTHEGIDDINSQSTTDKECYNTIDTSDSCETLNLQLSEELSETALSNGNDESNNESKSCSNFFEMIDSAFENHVSPDENNVQNDLIDHTKLMPNDESENNRDHFIRTQLGSLFSDDELYKNNFLQDPLQEEDNFLLSF